MTDFRYGQIFKVSKKKGGVGADFYVLSPDGPDYFMMHNLSYGSKLTGKFPHNRKPITMDMIEAAGTYFVSRGYIFQPIKNVELFYDIIPVVPAKTSENAKLRGGIY